VVLQEGDLAGLAKRREVELHGRELMVKIGCGGSAAHTALKEDSSENAKLCSCI